MLFKFTYVQDLKKVLRVYKHLRKVSLEGWGGIPSQEGR